MPALQFLFMTSRIFLWPYCERSTIRIKGNHPFFQTSLDFKFYCISFQADIDLSKRAGELSEEEVDKIVTIMQNPRQYKIPDWFLNRQKDIKDGKWRHEYVKLSQRIVRISNDVMKIQWMSENQRLKS